MERTVTSARWPRVAVVQLPSFDPGTPNTGAQVITAAVVPELAAAADVTVLHGYPPDSGRPGAAWRTAAGVRVVPAFPAPPQAWRGSLAEPLARQALRHCPDPDVLVSIELALPATLAGPPRVVVIGGFGYAHTFELLAERAWDTLVVPSAFVRDAVARELGSDDGVTVIENGLDVDRFAPVAAEPPPGGERDPVRLLVPGRPECIKGLVPALRLANALNAADVRTTVVSVRAPGGEPGAGREATGASATVESLPWRAYEAMPALYRSVDLTVCFSGIPEGFGLCAAESIACGTPVLAWPSGFLGAMLPRDHGLYHVDRDAPVGDWLRTARTALADGAAQALRHGRPYIEQRYRLSRMARQYAEVILGLAGRRTRVSIPERRSTIT